MLLQNLVRVCVISVQQLLTEFGKNEHVTPFTINQAESQSGRSAE